MKTNGAKIVVFGQKTKKGWPLKIRIIHNRKSQYYGLGYYLTDTEKSKQFGKNGLSDKYKYYNLVMEKYNQIVESLSVDDDEKDDVKIITGRMGLIQYIDKYIQELNDTNRFGLKQKVTSVKYNLIKFKGENIEFEDVNMQFLKDFNIFGIKRGMKDITIKGYLEALRAILYNAVNDDVYKYEKFPFSGFTITKPKPIKPKALTLNEFNTVKNVIYNDDALNDDIRKAGYMFLFSYYAFGMRYSDVVSLMWTDIKEDNYICYNMKKTGSYVKVYMNDELVKIICLFYGMGDNRFNVIVNSLRKDYRNKRIFSNIPVNIDKKEEYKKRDNLRARINVKLKELSDYVNAKYILNLHISTHVARHTFSFLQLTENKNDIYTISKALKHSSTKITEEYLGKFTDESLTNMFYNNELISDDEKITIDNQLRKLLESKNYTLKKKILELYKTK